MIENLTDQVCVPFWFFVLFPAITNIIASIVIWLLKGVFSLVLKVIVLIRR